MLAKNVKQFMEINDTYVVNAINTHGMHKQRSDFHRDTGSQKSFEHLANTAISQLISGRKVDTRHTLDDLEEEDYR